MILCAQCGQRVESTCDCGGPVALLDRFHLQRVLGHGSSGTVYLAVEIDTGLRVVIKEQLADSRRAHLVPLSHPCLPVFYDHLTHNDQGVEVEYLVREYVRGESLANELAHRRLSTAEIFELLSTVLDALAYLHSRGLVHRDVKASNLVRRESGELVLVDFGSAAAIGVRNRSESVDAHFTATGTVGYMPMEQIAGVTRPENDIYAVGALAVALLTRTDPVKLLNAHHRLEWEHLVALHPKQRAWLRRLLQSNPKRRPADTRALSEEAQALAFLQPTPSRSWAVPLVAALMLCVVGGAGLALYVASDAPPPMVVRTVVVEPPPDEPVVQPTPTPPQPPPFVRHPAVDSECARNDSCRDIAIAYEGISLNRAPEAPSTRRGQRVVDVAAPETATIFGREVRCRRRSFMGWLGVTCFHGQPEDGELEAYLQRVRDRYGPEDWQGTPNTYAWRSGAVSLKVVRHHDLRTYYETSTGVANAQLAHDNELQLDH